MDLQDLWEKVGENNWTIADGMVQWRYQMSKGENDEQVGLQDRRAIHQWVGGHS